MFIRYAKLTVVTQFSTTIFKFLLALVTCICAIFTSVFFLMQKSPLVSNAISDAIRKYWLPDPVLSKHAANQADPISPTTPTVTTVKEAVEIDNDSRKVRFAPSIEEQTAEGSVASSPLETDENELTRVDSVSEETNKDSATDESTLR